MIHTRKPPTPSERYCRFCGISKNVKVDIFATGLAQKAALLMNLPIVPTDPLPRLICERCKTSLEASYQFMINAITREIKLRRMHLLIPANKSQAIVDLTKTPDRVERKKTGLVELALEKLKSAVAVEVKKMPKPIEHGLPKLKIVALHKLTSGPEEVRLDLTETHQKLPEMDVALEKLRSSSVAVKRVPQVEDELPEFDYVSCTFPPSERAERKELEMHEIEKLMDVNRKYRRYSMEEYEIRGTPTYICQKCSGKFSSRAELQVHFRSEKNCQDPLPCPTCGKLFNCPSKLKSHRKIHDPKVRYPCQKCDYVAIDTFELDNHRADVHAEQLGFTYRCCDRKFPTLRELQEHEAKHEQLPLLCATCGKSFSNKNAFSAHQQTHSNVRPHLCTVCGATFKQRENLIRHGQQHTGIKLFRCDHCPKEFAKKDSIKNHYRKFHADEPMPMWSYNGEKLEMNSSGKKRKYTDQEPTEMVIEDPVSDFEVEALDEYLELEHLKK